VYDYVPGKNDWLAADLSFEGTARLAGMYTRRQVAIADEDTPAAEALARLEAQGFGPVVIVNHAGVVVGAAYRNGLRSAGPGAAVKAVMRPGVSTVRPCEETEGLARRMGDAQLTRVIVTRSDGTLVGLFFTSDAPGDLPSGPGHRAG
jgi:CBS-domain-containing membrane protein